MKCDRCKQEILSWKMSWFNTQHICASCQQEEQAHEAFTSAKQAVLEQERSGNMNYEGVGLPQALINKQINKSEGINWK